MRTTSVRAPAAGPLVDPQGRTLDYLRLAVTDRCNLRCRYCMPEEGVERVGHGDVLRFEELLRLTALLVRHGVRKVRVTGGEPLVRRGVVEFLADLAALPGPPEVLLTTNGVLLGDCLDAVRDAGVRRINLSLDSLDRRTFERIARRDALGAVLPLLDAIPAAGLGLKVNMVVVPGVNEGEIPAFAALARERDLTVRFIEPMPFAGVASAPFVPYPGDRILAVARTRHELIPVAGADHGVADLYTVPGWAGRVGVIRGHDRTFCRACSRLRIDARGGLRTCLYGAPTADLRGLVRSGADDELILSAVRAATALRFEDGHAAERHRDGGESMASIGG